MKYVMTVVLIMWVTGMIAFVACDNSGTPTSEVGVSIPAPTDWPHVPTGCGWGDPQPEPWGPSGELFFVYPAITCENDSLWMYLNPMPKGAGITQDMCHTWNCYLIDSEGWQVAGVGGGPGDGDSRWMRWYIGDNDLSDIAYCHVFLWVEISPGVFDFRWRCKNITGINIPSCAQGQGYGHGGPKVKILAPPIPGT